MDKEILTWIAGILATLFSALFGALYKKHGEEIADMKKKLDDMHLKADFDKHEDRMRDAVINLYGKIDATAEELRHSIIESERLAANRHMELLNALRSNK